MLSLRSSVASRIGAHRTDNQDRCLAGNTRAALADGMGGRHGGGLAAQLAIDTLARRPSATRTADLVDSFWAANASVVSQAALDLRFASMGTTLVAIELVQDDDAGRVAVGSVGDSRAYRLRGGSMWRITTDHTWEVALIAAGVDGAQHDRARHVLTRALGTSVTVEADMWELDARPGDRFLLCSDGVTGFLDDESLMSLLHERPGRQSAAEKVVSAAIDAGAEDDATAIVADVIASPGPLAHDRITRGSAHGPLSFLDGMLRQRPAG